MENEKLNEKTVVTGFDDNYVFPFLVMAYSATVNSNSNFRIKIAYGETLLSEENQTLVSKILTIFKIPHDFVPIKLDKDLKPQRHISITAFARLYLADTLKENFLWLDSDLICRRGWDDIFLEYESVLEVNVVCAAVDAIPLQNLLGSDLNLRNAAMIRMGQNYFNSGVLLVNSQAWQALNFVENWRRVYGMYSQLGFQHADQCVLNFMCFEKYHHLDAKYNVYATVRRHYVSHSDIKILHFPGGEKPWTFQKNSLATFLSSVSARHLYNYFKVQNDMIAHVRCVEPSLADYLNHLHRSLRRRRSTKYLMEKAVRKITKG